MADTWGSRSRTLLKPQSRPPSRAISERPDARQRCLLTVQLTEDWPQLAAKGHDCLLDGLCEIGNNEPSMDPLAKQLKRLRAARGLSQEALARKAHVSRGYLARIELGRHDPTLSVLRRLAKGLRVSVGDLVK